MVTRCAKATIMVAECAKNGRQVGKAARCRVGAACRGHVARLLYQRSLERCRDATGPDSRLLIIEGLIPDGDEQHPLKMLDVVIGLTIGGGERTLAEYESLLETAGDRKSVV